MAHEVETEFKTPRRKHETAKVLHWHVFGKPGEPGKKLRYSAEALCNFVATGEAVLSLLDY